MQKRLHKCSLNKLFRNLVFTMVALASFGFANGQERAVSGKVISGEDQQPIPGVNVLIKGTTNGAITDIDGSFKINVGASEDVLVFSFVGFITQEVSLGGRTTIDVTLGSDSKQLEEVVVTALGIKKELRTLGYTTQEVKGQDLVKAREPNPLNSLTGKVAGLTVGPSAELLGRPSLVLRGRADLLFVVDGVPVNSDTWNVSADDIETYTVLKGANAAALYGFRGQNGAILITTKRGSKDKRGFSVDFNSSTMLDNSFLTLPSNQDEYGAGSNYAYRFGDGPYDDAGAGVKGSDQRPNVWGPRFEGQNVKQYNSPIGANGIRTGTPWLAKGSDNYQKFMETGVLSNNNISISASNGASDLRLSISHSYKKGIAPNTGLNITNFNISAGHNFNSKLRLEGNLNLNRQYSDNIPDVNYGPNSYTYMFKVYGSQHWDIEDMKDYYKSPGQPGLQQYYFEYGRNNNPYFMSYQWLRGHYKTDVYGYTKLSYKVNDYLNVSLRTQVSTWNSLRNEKLPYSAIIYGRDLRQGDYREDNRSLFENNTDLLINFDKKITPDFHVTATVGGNIRVFQYNSSWESTDYLIVPGVYNLSYSKNPKLAYNYKSDMQVYSAYFSADFSYKNFVTLQLTGREDKLSTLPQANNSYFYPSVALSTVFSDYLKLPEFISFAKIRGSYANVKGGLTRSSIGPAWAASGQSNPLQYGTDYNTSYDGPSYDNQNTYLTKNYYNNTPAADYSSTLANAGLKPFSTDSYEIGADFKFLENRLGLDVTRFSAEDGPRILGVPVASSTGYGRKLVNDLVTQRNGWEIAVSGSPIKNAEGLTWDVTANWSTFKETVKKIDDPSGFINGYYGDHKYQVGDRVDGIYTYRYARTNEGRVINSGGLPLLYSGGTDAKKLLGYSNPDWVWAVNNRFTYKDFTFSFQFDGRVGGLIYNELRGDQLQGGTSKELVQGAFGVARRAEWESLKATATVDPATGLRSGGTITPSYISEGVKITSGTPKFDTQGNLTNYGELTFAENDVTTRLLGYVQFLQSSEKESMYTTRTFAKLREVVISYNIPSSILSKIGVVRGSISLVGRNLLYFSASKDFDLDQFANGGAGNPPLQTGTLRRYGVNINLTF